MSRFEYEILKVYKSEFNDVYEFKNETLKLRIYLGNFKYQTLLDALNLLGEQGWELCDKLKGEGYIMKRKIIDI